MLVKSMDNCPWTIVQYIYLVKLIENEGKKMKKFDINDDLGLEKRQPDTALNITSIVLGQEV